MIYSPRAPWLVLWQVRDKYAMQTKLTCDVLLEGEKGVKEGKGNGRERKREGEIRRDGQRPACLFREPMEKGERK